MGLAVGNKILAADFIALKARVKAECQRRRYKGSISKYAGTDYDYTVTPVTGGKILEEHINKLVEPMNAINDSGYSIVSGSTFPVRSLTEFEEFISQSESYPLRGTSSNCSASCTGLCLGGCGNTCQGCSGSCTGSCSGSCSGGCSGSCSGGCGDACSKECTGTCSSQCTTTCTGTCSGGCSGGCKGICSNNCTRTATD